MTHPVLIAGAGPTGLTLALFLARRGVLPRIVDAKPGPVDQSRALGVHARTLELYRFAGIAERVIAAGIPAERVHLMSGEREVTGFSIAEMGEGISPYPFMLTFPQDDHERLLVEALREAGVEVEWNTCLAGFDQDEDGVTARLDGPGGTDEARVAFLVGCEGGGSATRKALGLSFEGGTNEGLFYVADVATDRPSRDLFAALAEDTVSLMMPVRQGGAQRVLGIVPPALSDRDDLGFEDLRHLPETTLGVRITQLNWFSTYRVHHRVAERFGTGRIFIAGDAAHVHSPVGGQGMNTGIGDTANLAWKLADVLRGRASPSLLESYESERIAFARVLIETTDEAFGPMVAQGRWSAFLRSVVAPNALRLLTRMPGIPRRIFQTVSQTRITYRDGPLAEGKAGSVRGGDRLPWVEGADNFAPLASMDWQVHVYGAAPEALKGEAEALGLPMHAFDDEAAEGTGLAANGVYLIRPDAYVAAAWPRFEPGAIGAYLSRHGLDLAPREAAA